MNGAQDNEYGNENVRTTTEGHTEDPNRALLEVRNLSIEYRSPGQFPIRALKGISLQIRTGESVAVLGESGSGKSTLALSIMRLLPPTAVMVNGSIGFQEVDVLNAPDGVLEKMRGAQIAMIFQHSGMALNPYMRVCRQVSEVIQAHRPWGRARCLEEAKRVLKRVFCDECDRLLEAYPHELSGGQRQRVAITQAIACNPQLVIADEPTTSLDSVVQAGILQLFRELRYGSSVSFLFITHNPAILPGLADRVLVLRHGEMVEEGTLEQVYRYPQASYTAELLRLQEAAAD